MFKKEYFFVFMLIGLSILYVVLSFLVFITRGKWGRAFNKKLIVGATIVALCAILNTGTAFAQTAPPATPTPVYGTLEPTADPNLTPTPTAIPAYGIIGIARIEPATQVVKTNSDFTTEIRVNTGNKKLAAYGMDIMYSDYVISVNTSATGYNGVEPGADGYLAAVNATEPGILRVSGFDVSGTGPDSNLHLLTVFWTAGPADGSTIIDIFIYK